MDTTTVTHQQIIDIYKELLNQESSNHTIFISVLLGITIIILGATWWWNKNGANRFIKNTVKKEIDDKDEEIKLSIDEKINEKLKGKLKEMDEKFKILELDLYRSLGFSTGLGKMFSHSIFYWTNAIERAIELDSGELVRAMTAKMILDIKKLEPKEIHNLEKVKKIIEKLPTTLSIEKKEILTLLNECKNI